MNALDDNQQSKKSENSTDCIKVHARRDVQIEKNYEVTGRLVDVKGARKNEKKGESGAKPKKLLNET